MLWHDTSNARTALSGSLRTVAIPTPPPSFDGTDARATAAPEILTFCKRFLRVRVQISCPSICLHATARTIHELAIIRLRFDTCRRGFLPAQ